jgi:hypothetical protein
VVDAWACIDNLARMEKLVLRFPYGGPKPKEVNEFLSKISPARIIRNRIQHLDEDIFKGENCSSGYPVLGAVHWTDGRFLEGHAQFAVSSGPTIDGGTPASFQVAPPKVPNTVSDFRLLAADQTVSIDDLIAAARAFIAAFEIRLIRWISRQIWAWVGATGIPAWAFGKYWPCDMITAFRFLPKGEAFTFSQDQFAAHVEVPPGIMVPPLLEKDRILDTGAGASYTCKTSKFLRVYPAPWWPLRFQPTQ